MDDRKNKIIVGTVIGLIVLCVLILIIIKSTSLNCELVELEPKFDNEKIRLKNITSNDYKAIVNFYGYLIYNTTNLDNNKKNDFDPRRYLPINVDSISYEEINITHSKTDNSNTSKTILKRTLSLNGDCAKLIIEFNPIPVESLVIDNIDVKLTSPNEYQQSCIAKISPSIITPPGKHYRCKSKKSYDCLTKISNNVLEMNKTVANLVLTKFEFEINGAHIKFGQFGDDIVDC